MDIRFPAFSLACRTQAISSGYQFRLYLLYLIIMVKERFCNKAS